MAREQSEALPPELRDWVEQKAAERDTDPETILSRAVTLYRTLDSEADDPHESRLDAVDAELESLTERLSTVEDELADRVDRGFENYEEILEYLTDATDDMDEKADALAGAVVDLRAELQRVSAAEHDRQAVDDLQAEANRHGERTASCGDCGATVDIGLLSRPRCPHCEATFVDFDPASGFFSSATLRTGDHLALEGGNVDVPDDPADLFDLGAGTGGSSDD